MTTMLNRERVNNAPLEYQVVVSITPEAEVLWATCGRRPHAYRMVTTVAVVADNNCILCYTTDFGQAQLREVIKHLQRGPTPVVLDNAAAGADM